MNRKKCFFCLTIFFFFFYYQKKCERIIAQDTSGTSGYDINVINQQLDALETLVKTATERIQTLTKDKENLLTNINYNNSTSYATLEEAVAGLQTHVSSSQGGDSALTQRIQQLEAEKATLLAGINQSKGLRLHRPDSGCRV